MIDYLSSKYSEMLIDIEGGVLSGVLIFGVELERFSI